jgi:hypothetical protein
LLIGTGAWERKLRLVNPPDSFRLAVVCALLAAGIGIPVAAQHAGAFRGSLDDPSIAYSTAALNNAVADVNKKLQDGSVQFSFDSRSGFLQSALDALDIRVDSQLLVFSRGSLQGKRIGEQNPRAVYFNDRVALGWVRGGNVIEVAAHDASKGVVFYTLEQRSEAVRPTFTRKFECLGCHVTGDTLGVPGLLMFTTTRAEPGAFDGVPRHVDHSTPLERRFGGWFVTGNAGAVKHLGNKVAVLDGRSTEIHSVAGLFDTDGYRSLSSDIVAHLVLTHQAGMINLLTRAGFEGRSAEASLHDAPTMDQKAAVDAMMEGIAREVVDHLLFIDEAKLAAAVSGGSGFAERFSSSHVRDRKGRSLYELDLHQRLMRYPCSYLIYSPAFDQLPGIVKAAIYRRMWQVLSGDETDPRYRSALSRADRESVAEILRDTMKDLPSYFRGGYSRRKADGVLGPIVPAARDKTS